jgi:hypothetical protein
MREDSRKDAPNTVDETLEPLRERGPCQSLRKFRFRLPLTSSFFDMVDLRTTRRKRSAISVGVGAIPGVPSKPWLT